MVAVAPAQIVEELTVTVGAGLTVTVPLAGSEEQFAALVITTLYVPATVEVKEATLPGSGTPAGTVQA